MFHSLWCEGSRWGASGCTYSRVTRQQDYRP